MSQNDPEFMERARRAQDRLSDQFLQHPAVSMIDIGYDPENSAANAPLVLRVHLRQPSDRRKIKLPEEIDGIPVRVIIADYRLE